MRGLRIGFLVYLWCHLCLLTSATVAEDLNNPKPVADDLTLPMPYGVSIAFRPVFIGVGENPFALKIFNMGDPTGGFRENRTKVGIGGAFRHNYCGQPDWLYYIGKYEVTEAQYDAIMVPEDSTRRTSRYPISNISWFEAQEFIHKYNLWLFKHARDQLPRHGNALGYVRLPTEIEWEFTARGGAEVAREQFDAQYPYIEEPLRKYEWFSGPSSSHGKVQKIGALQPNPLQLYDMLGNVAEMTSSFYQIEYYQGRVGGFVARGGDYITPEKDMRTSLRHEQPFYGRELQPQRSPTLGLRLVISAVILAGLDTSGLEEDWKKYHASSVRHESPAAISIAPPATQTGVQLVEAADIVRKLVQEPTLSQDTRRQLEILQSSFGNIEVTIKRAEVDSAYAWIETAVNRALYVAATLKNVPVLQRGLENAKSSRMKAEIIAQLESQLSEHIKDIEIKLNDYSESLHQLDRHEKDSIEQAGDKYMINLKRTGDTDRINILNKAVKEHFQQYSKSKRIDIPQWKTDLGKF